MRETTDDHELTIIEARELLVYHATRASDFARQSQGTPAMAHALAAQALKDAILMGGLNAS